MEAKAINKLTDQQRIFLEKILDIGLSVIVPEPKLCDKTRGTSDDERLRNGWCWAQDKAFMEQLIRKVLYNGEYEVGSAIVASDTFLTSVGIYYKDWKDKMRLKKIKNNGL